MDHRPLHTGLRQRLVGLVGDSKFSDSSDSYVYVWSWISYSVFLY